MKRKMFAALALSATLAMGTIVPAFAVEVPGKDVAVDNGENALKQDESDKAIGSTTLSVKTYATNIQATIPLSMTVAGPAEGGALKTPDNYVIKNGSVYGIDVNVKADMTDSKLALLSDSTASSSADADKININLKPATVGTAFALKTAESTPWTIGAKTTSDTECKIEVSGSVSKTGQTVGVPITAMKLVYTIAPAAPATPAAQ